MSLFLSTLFVGVNTKEHRASVLCRATGAPGVLLAAVEPVAAVPRPCRRGVRHLGSPGADGDTDG